jgi:hypothetical protein
MTSWRTERSSKNATCHASVGARKNMRGLRVRPAGVARERLTATQRLQQFPQVLYRSERGAGDVGRRA